MCLIELYAQVVVFFFSLTRVLGYNTTMLTIDADRMIQEHVYVQSLVE